MLLLALACTAEPPPPAPADWNTPADCDALPPSGKRDVCYTEVLPAVFCADPTRGEALLPLIDDVTFRDAVLSRITREHFPTTDAYCARIQDAERQSLCRQGVVRARLEETAHDPGCAAAPMADLPRAAWCTSDGPATRLRLFSPTLTPPVGDVHALLGTLPGRLARCHQEAIYPGCPGFLGDATVSLVVAEGAVTGAEVTGTLPAAAAACMEQAALGSTLGAHTGTVVLPVGIAP